MVFCYKLPSVLLITCWLFFQNSSYAAPQVIDRIDASVNSSIILFSDVAKFREIAPLRAQLDPLFQGTTIAEKGSNASEEEIVDFLINEKIILQEFKVTDAEVEQQINEIQAGNKINRTTLKSTLEAQGFLFDDYFDLIRASVAKRNLIDRDIRSKVSITDDDIKNYFYNHYARNAAASVSYKVRIITVTPENYKSLVAARETAARALQEIRRGEPFEDVAKRISDDPTAETGGDLGTLTEEQMSPFIKSILKNLQIGQTSEVISAPDGRLMILKLADLISADTERYEKMKDEIRNHLASSEYQHQISLWLERQRQVAFIHKAGQPSPVNPTR